MGIFKQVAEQKGGAFSQAAQTQQSQKDSVSVGGVPLSLGTIAKSYIDTQRNVGEGIKKGVLSTAKGIGTAGYKIGTAIGLPSLQGQEIYQTGSPEETALAQELKPEGIAQNVGYLGEKVLETAIPGKALGVADKALGGIKNVVGRVLGKTALDTTAQGALGYVQSGGDTDVAKTQALISAPIKFATSVLGELAQKANLPTKLYQGFLKDPELAKEAKNRGLQGSLDGMTTQVKEILPNIEKKVIDVARATDTRVPVNPKLADVFSAMEDDLSKLADDTLATKARALASLAKDGSVDMETALEMRRFLDSEIAYTKSGLAPKGDRVLKSFADELRTKINGSDIGGIMKDYQFYIKTADALRKEAIRAGNREVVGLFDTILFGSGLASAEPVTGLVAAGTQKAVRSMQGRTALAQLLDKLPQTSSIGTALKSLLGQSTQNK